jgi:DNA invertase Pin-like site-specific DNA recombinase
MEQKIIDMFKEGYGHNKIASVLKIHHGIVVRTLKANNLHRTKEEASKLRGKLMRGKPCNALTQHEQDEIVRLYTAGIGADSIGIKMKIKSSTVQLFIKSLGIARTREQGHKARRALGAFNEKVEV